MANNQPRVVPSRWQMTGKRPYRAAAVGQPKEERSAGDEATATVAFRVSTSEASGPSGAGSRASSSRRARLDKEMKLAVPTLRSFDRK